MINETRDNISAFLVEIALDTKQNSIAGQALDMALKLVAPEYDNKMWNKHKLFVDFLQKNNVADVLFSYKDKRFGCLSRAAAVLLFYWDWISIFLQDNPHISNRIACLLRDLMELAFLKVLLVAFAAIGVHLIEPFYCRTIVV